MLAAATIHRGEEPPISGHNGSATFFFSGCPLACSYCQNFPISRLAVGTPTTVDRISRRMLQLEKRGAHNVNCVTGTQYAPEIVDAVRRARAQGMKIPVVWNTSGYETAQTIELLRGTVDIYLTDIKYADDRVAMEISGATDYWRTATGAAMKMLDQVGPLATDERGISTRGVLIRHLVLPGGLGGTRRVMEFIRNELGRNVPVSLMCQYFPAHKASDHDLLSRGITSLEWEEAVECVHAARLEVGWIQDPEFVGHS